MSDFGKDKLKKTPLHGLHIELGAKMVPFAGYDMPVQYPLGILKEHIHTRASAGLFDVSHMGQARLNGRDAPRLMEKLVPGNISGLEEGKIRYTFLTNDSAGIIDDLTIGRSEEFISLVVNASRKEIDYAHIEHCLGKNEVLEVLEDYSLLALQGPAAAEVLSRHVGEIKNLKFMQFATISINGTSCTVARSGYTGEDGFEISVPSSDSESLARTLLSEPEVKPIGLGARDSLRLEAGLCLYGHDLDETTTPVEAKLLWTIPKNRREDGGYPGAEVIKKQISDGVARKRIGILPAGRVPVREGAEIFDKFDKKIGVVTSGGFGPTVGGPVAMGYIETNQSELGTEISIMVRGALKEAVVTSLPFTDHHYFK